MVNKKIVISSTIVALVVVITIVAINIRKFNEVDYTETETNLTANTYNEVTNDIEENLIEEEVADNNETIEENSSNSEKTNYQGEEEVETDEINYEEKALELAKSEWGEDDSVYYTVDNQSGNIYYISVRDKSTTASLAEYKVNPSTGEISDY